MTFQLPPAAEEIHRAISQKAALLLGGLVDGNGLKAVQVRLVRQDTQIHAIPAVIKVTLKPEIAKSQLRGRSTQGTVLNTDAEVMPAAVGLARSFLENGGVQQEALQALKKIPGEGFGMEPLALAIRSAGKEFSVIAPCLKCNGSTVIPCIMCRATGKTPCQTCRGQGFSPCRMCFGVGMVQDASGNRVSCTYCQHTGRIICATCNGHQQLTCATCSGRGSTPCAACGQSGSLTSVYRVAYQAVCRFEIDWHTVPPEARKIAEKIGVRLLAAKGYADVYWQPPELQEDHLSLPCVAFLPIASAEFSVEGKIHPAVVAGLQGRLVQIDPLLDAAVKPGISALMKLSKGPLAVQALIDTACKYRLIRQVLAQLARSPKKIVYQALVRDYPFVLSDKYARATVLYAHRAILSISTGPRYKGLAVGTVLAALAAAGYYMTPVRPLLLMMAVQRNIPQLVTLADIAVWLLGYTIVLFTIKFMTVAALKKMLPETVRMAKGGLPSAGLHGLAAFFTSGLVWFAAAACATMKPEWIIHILKLAKL